MDANMPVNFTGTVKDDWFCLVIYMIITPKNMNSTDVCVDNLTSEVFGTIHSLQHLTASSEGMKKKGRVSEKARAWRG